MPRYRLLKVELNRDYRNDLNKNFEDFERDIVKAETNIKRVETETLQKVDEIVGGGFIESLELARDNANESSVEANTQAAYAKTQGDHAKAQGDLANAAAINADSKAQYAEEKALLADEAAAKAELEASNLGTLKNNVVDATQAANTAATNADEKALEAEIAITDTIAATHAANEATEAVQAVVDNTGYEEEYSDDTAYKRNNIVSYKGSSFIAKQDTKGNLPTDEAYWGLIAEKGEQGTGLNIIGSLNSESQLPSTGDLGNAYLINGDLYVWDGITWRNAGNIKGPKGDTGERGLKGDKGEKGDQGIQGIKGEKGDQGIQGPKGDTGEPGMKGDKGDQGIQGPKGDKGDPGEGANVPDASTTQKGIVRLNNTLTSISTIEAATANAAKQLNDSKVNRGAPSYIEPPLENGWTNIISKPRVYKDEFGFVHIFGALSGGTTSRNTRFFILPDGYRPPLDVSFVGNSYFLADGGKMGNIEILKHNGWVRISNDTGQGSYFLNVSFPSE